MTTNSNRREQPLSLALPITTHYKINNRNLILFLESYKRGFNAIAYQYGKQFVETALYELPKHGYFKSSRHRKEREKSSLEAWQVTNILEAMLGDEAATQCLEDGENSKNNKLDDSVVIIEMDPNEKRIRQKEVRELKLKIEDVYDASPKSIVETCSEDILSTTIENIQIENEPRKDGETLWSEWVEIWNENTTARLCNILSLSNSDVSGLCGTGPKLEKKDSDEPVSERLYPSAESKNVFHLSDSNLAEIKSESIPLFPEESSEIKTPKNNPNTTIPISSLTQCYKEDFQDFINIGKVTINHLKTYQGRSSPNGINGCTVIAPLIAIYHFMDDSSSSNSSHDLQHSASSDGDYVVVSSGATLPNEVIEEIIDVQAPVILPYVRENLGLTKDALIIPSDVHDYLLKESLLSQDQFVDVYGGNILNEEHLEQFMKIFVNSELEKASEEKEKYFDEKNRISLLNPGEVSKPNNANGGRNKTKKRTGKMAATMFYHEHVMCILRYKSPEGEYSFEIIDSLPNKKTIACFEDANSSRKSRLGSTNYGPGQRDSTKARKIPLDNYQNHDFEIHFDKDMQQETDARMAQRIMIQQQREEEEQRKNMSLSEGIALVDNMDENVVVALAAAVSAAEAERAAAASEDSAIWSGVSDDEQQINAVRIKCKDLRSLKATLRWYGCSRFSDENMQYIDEYEWDDRNIEFDPRVFQAFIWAE